MEGYILGGRNIAETTLKRQFQKQHGRRALQRLEKWFRDRFITEEDFANIARMGARVVRVPFNHRLIEPRPYQYSRTGLGYLRKVFQWADRHKLKIILDLHAAAGSQNFDWHGDNTTGKALLWEKDYYRKRTYALWELVAGTFKDEPALYAYDVLNEPVLGEKKPSVLIDFYARLIKRIRAVDPSTLIYLEGSHWSQKIDFLKHFVCNNIGISIHYYQPINYTANFTPLTRYPGRMEGALWNKNTVKQSIAPYAAFARKHKARIFVGEFGLNWRGGAFGELSWLKDVLGEFDRHGFDYTYWTYKAMANATFPDGLYQHIPNHKFICREGPASGFETYARHWKNEKEQLADFWLTKNFTPNQPLLDLLFNK
jgi:aryl-phospho-beta-D-glucosidase BglC (GH1 family)